MDQSRSEVARCIRLAREGDGRALNDLLAAYRSYLRVLAASGMDPALRGKVDASDVVQDVLLKANREFGQFRGVTAGEWAGWVRSILARNLVDLHRRYSYASRAVARERTIDRRLDESSRRLEGLLVSPDPSPSDGAVEHESGALLADALDGLDPDDREVVMLRSLQELEWSEVASRMGRSTDAARMLWTRAIRRLGARLKGRLA